MLFTLQLYDIIEEMLGVLCTLQLQIIEEVLDAIIFMRFVYICPGFLFCQDVRFDEIFFLVGKSNGNTYMLKLYLN